VTGGSRQGDGQLSANATIRVEVAWVEARGLAEGIARDSVERAVPSGAGPQVRLATLDLSPGATLGEALLRLGDPALVAALASGDLVPAVYGERVPVSQVLIEGDRIELLGPLIADPKQSRGRRAEVQRARRGDARWGRR